MKNEEIIYQLNNIHRQNNSLEVLAMLIRDEKRKFVKQNDQEQAKQLWIYQTIVEIHKLYIEVFNLLKHKSYYKAWCLLEQIEITFGFLKRHFRFNKTQYYLWHIEKSVKNLQVIFPYKIFASSEILKKKKKCGICGKEVSIRKSCGHVVGDIYDGEMCHFIVTESELLGIALVENPENKYSVMFLTDEKTGEKIDQYNYEAIDYLFELINSPYEVWNLEVSQREFTKEDFNNAGRNDLCPCNSGKKFKKCCADQIGTNYPHYEFIVRNPSNMKLLSNTINKI